MSIERESRPIPMSPEMLKIAYIYVRLLKRKETEVLMISRAVVEV